MRIRSYLGMMAAAMALPILVAATIAVEKIRDGEREAALRGLKETARSVSLIVDREMQGSFSALEVLGNSANLESKNFKAFYEQAAALHRPDAWFLLLDSTGTQIVNTVVPFGTPPPPPVAFSRVTQVIAAQKPIVTDLAIGPVTGKQLTSAYVPSKAGDGKTFVVARAFAVDYWKTISLHEGIPSDWIVGVIDRSGKFIARSHKSEELLGKPARPELVAAAASSKSGLIRHSTVEGTESYDAYTHSELTGWTVAVAAPVESIEASANRVVQLALAGIFVAIFSAFCLAFVIGRRLIDAIHVAGNAALLLGQGRKPPTIPSPISELDALNNAFNEASKVLASERASRQAAESDRQHLLQKETEARKNAEAQNIAKDQFLAMLGHELRNPLAAITSATALLKMGLDDEFRNGRCLDIIDRQNRHLNFIVDDLLDVSRLLTGKIVLELQPLNLAESVKLSIEGIRNTERAHGYHFTINSEPVWVNADAVRIEQVINNLINNALKFSPVGSTITVELHADAGRALLTVRDEGVGIPENMLSKIFDPFVQGPPPANRLHAGLGIGLALVKQLMELHGGDVQAQSEGHGRGSVFTLSLPSITAPRRDGDERAHGVLAGARPTAGTSKRKLVYVEDNADTREATSALFASLGYEVVEVARGADALAAVIWSQPDAVVVDIGLPDIDGYEVAARIRANATHKTSVIIALTGYGQIIDKGKAAEAGFDAHFVKPADILELTQAIEKILASKGQGQG